MGAPNVSDLALASVAPLQSTIDAVVAELRAAARDAADASKAPATERAYAADWRDFRAFTASIGREALPAEPETVALYVADLAARGRRPATIARKLATIGIYHKASGFDAPTAHGVVRDVERGYRRKLGVAQQQKTALVRDPLLAVLAPIPSDLRGLRDRALILVGWAAALRRSELAALEIRDVVFEREGVVLAIRRSKRDQEGQGEEVAVLFSAELEQCAVRALQAWLGAGALADGSVFRSIARHGTIGPNLSPWAIGEIVKARVAAAGLVGDFGAHSLRSGFATAAARGGFGEAAIMKHGRWKSVAVARRYIRAGNRWDESVSVL